MPDGEVVLETDRLLLRPRRPADAVVERELWAERDPRVPSHGRTSGLLAVEQKAAGDGIGHCGLIDSERGPELAFELLRRG